MNLPKKIDTLMKKDNLNKRQLAIKSGIPYMTITNWYKRGYDGMTVASLRTLCTYFGVTMDSMAYDDREIEYVTDREMIYSSDEAALVRRFRALDDDGRQMVETVLDTALWQKKKTESSQSAESA